jgi:spore germination protein KC
MLKRSADEIGVTTDMKVIDLINSLASEGVDPALTGVEINREGKKANNTDVLKQSGDFDKLKFGGLAAFDGDRLAGWLSEEESKGYGYITEKIKGSLEIVRCDEKSEVNCNILSCKAKARADTAGGKPSIAVEISVKYAVSGTRGAFDVTEKSNIESMNKALENKIKRICAKALSKAQGKLQTDIFGFGEAVHRTDPSLWKAVKDNWSAVYSSMPVKVEVKAELVSIGEITKPVYSRKKG